MDISKLDRGLQIVGGAAIVLLISLFLPWYSVSATLGPGLAKVSTSASGWQALSYTDLLLFLLSVAAIAAVVAVAMGKLPELPAPLSQILLGISALALLLVLFRLIFTPGDGGGIVDIGRSVGVFIALIAAAAMVYGATQTAEGPGISMGSGTPAGRGTATGPGTSAGRGTATGPGTPADRGTATGPGTTPGSEPPRGPDAPPPAV